MTRISAPHLAEVCLRVLSVTGIGLALGVFLATVCPFIVIRYFDCDCSLAQEQ